MDGITQILQKFSFTDQEVKIYLAALELGKSPISQIAHKAKLSRTNAYFHIKNLINKNVLQESKKGTKILITPTPPSHLVKTLQTNVNIFKNLIPQLNALTSTENTLPQIEIYESALGFKQVYEEISNMPQGAEFKVLENNKSGEAELSLLTDEQWESFFKKIIQKRIITKALFTNELINTVRKQMSHSSYKKFSDRMWNMRLLKENQLPVDNLILLYNSKVAFLTPDNSLVVIIQHKNIVNMINVLFETIFGFADAVENPWK
ncbi:MAG: helix-turn-helix domain-containing protein [Candidatus Komeilibacteria bacterium]